MSEIQHHDVDDLRGILKEKDFTEPSLLSAHVHSIFGVMIQKTIIEKPVLDRGAAVNYDHFLQDTIHTYNIIDSLCVPKANLFWTCGNIY